MTRHAALALAFGLSTALFAQQAQPPQQKPPLIRSQITTVPIDVRVVGRDGKPITDLRAEDFEVYENGVRQTLQHFWAHAFTADPAAAPAAPGFSRGDTAELAPSNRRVFLLMLGRGRHQDVSKYVAGLRDFVTRQLLPQDQVAVMAWNRATDFTGDRARIAALLDSYEQRHRKIETQLREWFSGLRAVYGSKDIPPHVQQEIDAAFATAGELRPRALSLAPLSDVGARTEQMRRAAEEIQRDELLKTFPDANFLGDMRASILASLADLTFDEYVALSSDVMQDLGNLYAAIDYLRYLEGEKHIVLLTERGVDLPLLEGNRGLASVAADARIAINIIQTGGMVGAPPPRFVMTPQGSRLVVPTMPSAGMIFNQGFSVRDLRMIADQTGGQMAAFTKSADAFNRLSDTLGHQYLLAYSPIAPATDGKFRNIEVKVRRAGARVLYRHGYYATPRVIPLNRRDFITFSRIRAAASLGRDIDHIGVKIEDVKEVNGWQEVDVQLRIDVSKLSFTTEGGVRRASLDVALYAGGRKSATVGQALSRADLNFRNDGYERALATGAPVTVRMTLTAPATHLKVVVYDYGADLIGTVVKKLGS